MKLDDAHDAPLSRSSAPVDFADVPRAVETSKGASDISPVGSHARGTRSTHAELTPSAVRDIPPTIHEKVSAHRACPADADRFAVELRREEGGWKASCVSLHHHWEATGPTPGQALSRRTRVINRHLHRHHRARRVFGGLASAELKDRPRSAASFSTDEG